MGDEPDPVLQILHSFVVAEHKVHAGYIGSAICSPKPAYAINGGSVSVGCQPDHFFAHYTNVFRATSTLPSKPVSCTKASKGRLCLTYDLATEVPSEVDTTWEQAPPYPHRKQEGGFQIVTRADFFGFRRGSWLS